MKGINGRWRVVSVTNLEAYHDAVKSSEEVKEKIRLLGAESKTNPDVHFEEFHLEAGGKLRKSTFIKGEKTRDTNYQIGGEVEHKTPDGRSVKVTLTPAGDNKVTIYETGPDFVVTGFLEVKGNELTLSLTSSGVNSVTTFTKIA